MCIRDRPIYYLSTTYLLPIYYLSTTYQLPINYLSTNSITLNCMMMWFFLSRLYCTHWENVKDYNKRHNIGLVDKICIYILEKASITLTITITRLVSLVDTIMAGWAGIVRKLLNSCFSSTNLRKKWEPLRRQQRGEHYIASLETRDCWFGSEMMAKWW